MSMVIIQFQVPQINQLIQNYSFLFPVVCDATSVLKQFSDIDDAVSPLHCVCVCVCVHGRAHSVTSNSQQTRGLQPARLSAHGSFQARILEWVAISSSRGPSPPRGQTRVSCISHSIRWDTVPPIPTAPPGKSFILFHGLFFCLFPTNDHHLNYSNFRISFDSC